MKRKIIIVQEEIEYCLNCKFNYQDRYCGKTANIRPLIKLDSGIGYTIPIPDWCPLPDAPAQTSNAKERT